MKATTILALPLIGLALGTAVGVCRAEAPSSHAAQAPDSAPSPDQVLLAAAARGDVQAIRRLSSAGAELQTALSGAGSEWLFAAAADVTDRVRELPAAGCAVKAKEENACSPPHESVFSGHAEAVLLLLAAGVDARNKRGETPLHRAARNGHTDAMRLLLAAGADVNAKDENGRTPLHGAAEGGHTDAAGLLLEAGADANAKAEDGRTPLHGAAEKGNTAVAELLRAHGAEE